MIASSSLVLIIYIRSQLKGWCSKRTEYNTVKSLTDQFMFTYATQCNFDRDKMYRCSTTR